jgi:hypothetical protein
VFEQLLIVAIPLNLLASQYKSDTSNGEATMFRTRRDLGGFVSDLVEVPRPGDPRTAQLLPVFIETAEDTVLTAGSTVVSDEAEERDAALHDDVKIVQLVHFWKLIIATRPGLIHTRIHARAHECMQTGRGASSTESCAAHREPQRGIHDSTEIPRIYFPGIQ